MSNRVDLTGHKFNHWTVIEELGYGKILCECDCTNHTRKVLDKNSVKTGRSKCCGCENKFKELKGQIFGYWTVLDDIDNSKARCKCKCGTIRDVSKALLKNGKSQSCGCKSRTIDSSMVGNKYNHLAVIDAIGDGKLICKCDCGNIKEYYKYRVLDGTSKSCGCKSSEIKSKANIINLKGKTINDWTIIEELGHGMVKCMCTCGTIKTVEKGTILNGASKSCGHNTNKFNNLVGKQFGNWEVIEELGRGFVMCRCYCGNTAVVQKPTLLQGRSKSCGCKQYSNFLNTALEKYGEVTSNRFSNPRDRWQIEAIKTKEAFLQLINSKFSYKPTIIELTGLLGINEASVGRVIKRLEVEKYIDIRHIVSSYENELYDYISSIYNGVIEQSNRTILNGKELDIYIPEKNIAIEFNGNYWHSDIYKDKNYHQNKTAECGRKNIRLIHIYEYEWNNKETKEKIKNYLDNIFEYNIKKLYARQLDIKEIGEFKDVQEFENKYHFQESANSSINIGLYKDNELVQLMTFANQRLNSEYQYELVRFCQKNNISIIGGAERIFKYFVETYKPDTIISYCNLDKFIGSVYFRLGFKYLGLTEPGYVWVNSSKNKILTRYKTQKHKLIEQGLGTNEQTESEMMESLDFLRIYNSGNLKFVYSNKIGG